MMIDLNWESVSTWLRKRLKEQGSLTAIALGGLTLFLLTGSGLATVITFAALIAKFAIQEGWDGEISDLEPIEGLSFEMPTAEEIARHVFEKLDAKHRGE